MNFFQWILNFFLAIPRFFIQLFSKDSNDAGLSKTAAVNQEMKKLLCPFVPENREKIMDFVTKQYDDKNLDEIVSVLFDKEVKYETIENILEFFPDHTSKIHKDLIEMKNIKKRVNNDGTWLYLPQCYINKENVDLVMTVLKHMPHLRSLILSGNHFKEVDFSDKLSEVLKILTNLERLEISLMMKITPEILNKLSGGLAALTKLKKLDLSLNPIGDAGATILAEKILPKLTALKELVIHSCSIGSLGFKAILKGLNSSNQIQLDVSYNCAINSECKDDVVKNLEKFKKLNISVTGINKITRNELEEEGKKKEVEVIF